VVGLFKTKLIKPQGPWRTVEQVEIATLEWVDWYEAAQAVGPRPATQPQRSPDAPGDSLAACASLPIARFRLPATATTGWPVWRSEGGRGDPPSWARDAELMTHDSEASPSPDRASINVHRRDA